MDLETLEDAFQLLAEAISQAVDTCAEAFQALEDAITKSCGIDIFRLYESELKRKGISPKRYGMSLRKQPRTATMHYHYTPQAVRNRPYQRRSF